MTHATPGRLPDFLVIGAMKCGTSSLHDFLASDSRFFMTTPKEPNFFSDDAIYAQGLEWYVSLFAKAEPHQICGESSTHYTKLPTHPHTVPRMKPILEAPKFIYIMRDPLERIVSQYIHEWTRRDVSEPFEDAVRNHERFVSYSLYATQLRPYLDAYGAERILLVFLERLNAFPDAEIARILAFLGVAPPCPRLSGGLPSSNVSRERLRTSSLRDTLLAMPGANTVAGLLPSSFRHRLKRFWQMRDRPQFSIALRHAVSERVDADLADLDALLGLPLRSADWKAQVTRATGSSARRAYA